MWRCCYRVVDAGSSVMTAPSKLLGKAGPSCTLAASPTTTKASQPPLASVTLQCLLWTLELPKMATPALVSPDQRGIQERHKSQKLLYL